MRKYEVMYIVDASHSDEQRSALVEKLHGIITDDGGKLLEVNEWGVREFAYPINHMNKGYYIVTTFEASPAAVKEFERVARIEAGCVRHLMINLEE